MCGEQGVGKGIEPSVEPGVGPSVEPSVEPSEEPGVEPSVGKCWGVFNLICVILYLSRPCMVKCIRKS